MRFRGFRNSGREELRNGATTASCSKTGPPASRGQDSNQESPKNRLSTTRPARPRQEWRRCMSVHQFSQDLPCLPKKCPLFQLNSRLREFRDWPSLEWRIFIQDSLIHSFIPVSCGPYPRFKSFLGLSKCEDYLLFRPMFLFFPKNQPQKPHHGCPSSGHRTPWAWQD